MFHMKHNDHGYHICYTQAEVKVCEKAGWKRCDYAKEHDAARRAKKKAAKAIADERKAGEEIVKVVAESNDTSAAY